MFRWGGARRVEKRKTEGGVGQDQVRVPRSLHCAARRARIRRERKSRVPLCGIGMTVLGMVGMVWNGHAPKGASHRN